MEAKGGEVRRLHIIYFLSHMGRTEHPHLIRVHHLARYGVYLRDVKRWLGALRGKELPEAFAWSYKRRYKNGYVWQDLFDDDLITPISDNEYVLKGSQIHPTPFDSAETRSLDEKKLSVSAEEKSTQVQVADDKQQQQPSLKEPQIEKYPHSKSDSLTKISSEISEESIVFSSGMSSLTEEYDSSKVEEDHPLGSGKQIPDEQSNKKFENYSLPSLYDLLMNRKSRNQSKNEGVNKTAESESLFSTSTTTTTTTTSSSSQSSFKNNKSNITGASAMFRNLMSCGVVDTDDAVLVMVNRNDKNASRKSDEGFNNEAKICKFDQLGGSCRSFGTPWNHHQQHGGRKSSDGEMGENRNQKMQVKFMNQTACKPFEGSICSHAGNVGSRSSQRKCTNTLTYKGMKALANSAATSAEKAPLQRSSSANTDSTCNKLPTN